MCYTLTVGEGRVCHSGISDNFHQNSEPKEAKMTALSKIVTTLFLAATLFLQGCATNKSNILCAGPQGCQSKTVAANTQWSVQLGDNLFVHPEYKDLYVHPQTGAWEPSATCGTPSLLRTLTYSLIGGVASGVAYKFVSNPYAAGAVGGAANGLANQMNQSGLNQACRNAATVAAQHNAQPEVAYKIIEWDERRQQEQNRVRQQVRNELAGTGAPQQVALAAPAVVVGSTEWCYAEATQKYGGAEQFVKRCQASGRSWGAVTTPQGQKGCGCQ